MRSGRGLASALALTVAACSRHGDGPPEPNDLELLTSVAVAPTYGIHDTYVRDGLAFVCAWNAGLLIYDVGNGIKSGTPADPVLVGSVVPAAANPTDGASVHNAWWFHNPVTAENRYVFLGEEGPGAIGASSTGDLHVIDVSDLEHPAEVASFHMPDVDGEPAGPHNFWMDEPAQILYAAYYNAGVVAFDVSGTLAGDLSSRVISTIRPGGAGQTFTWGVQLHDGSLYAIDMLSGFWEFPSTAGLLGAATGGGANVADRYSSDLWVIDGYAYTGTWGSAPRGGNRGDAVKIWRLADDGSPTLADSIKIDGIGTVSDLEVSSDDRLLLVTAEGGAVANRGLFLYDIANREKPALVANFAVGTGLHTGTFARIGGRLYVFAAKNPAQPALMIWDVTSFAP